MAVVSHGSEKWSLMRENNIKHECGKQNAQTYINKRDEINKRTVIGLLGEGNSAIYGSHLMDTRILLRW
jgi:hypothetical protein